MPDDKKPLKDATTGKLAEEQKIPPGAPAKEQAPSTLATNWEALRGEAAKRDMTLSELQQWQRLQQLKKERKARH
jgi:hypothetical protein